MDKNKKNNIILTAIALTLLIIVIITLPGFVAHTSEKEINFEGVGFVYQAGEKTYFSPVPQCSIKETIEVRVLEAN